MLLLYEEGLRVVIHTSNLIHEDWHQKTQGCVGFRSLCGRAVCAETVQKQNIRFILSLFFFF